MLSSAREFSTGAKSWPSCARCAAVADVVDIGAGHLAPQGQLLDGGLAGAFLGRAHSVHHQQTKGVSQLD
jgi:hypothetical protein